MRRFVLPLIVPVLSLLVAGLSYKVSILTQDIDDLHRRCNVVQAWGDENSGRLDALEKLRLDGIGSSGNISDDSRLPSKIRTRAHER